MVKQRNFIEYVEENARSNSDVPGRATNRLEVLFVTYVEFGGQFPKSDEACRDVVAKAMDSYFKIKEERSKPQEDVIVASLEKCIGGNKVRVPNYIGGVKK